ncbi:unnamed protein product [Penicillium pancosmium]
MSDPLSIAADAAGLLSLGIQVSESFLKFYVAYKSQDDNITRVLKKLENLFTVFRSLQAALEAREFHPGEEKLVLSIEDSINDCEEIIQELEDESKKYVKAPESGTRDKIKTATRRVAYPFRVSTLNKLEEDIRDIQVNLGFALTVLNQGGMKAIHDDLIDAKSLLESLQEFKFPQRYVRQAETGTWFINGQHYHEWLDRENSFLWLNGFAGCGKSVLCSTVIQHTFLQKRPKAEVGIAFFFFTFSDQYKQDESAMAKALLLQLAGQRKECEDELTALYRSYQSGTPHIDTLLASLQKMIQRFSHVYILLDALDECTRSERQWDLPGLHLLVTSHDEPDIRQALCPSVTEDIVLKNEEIDKDIRNYIFHELETNQSLRKWQAHRDEVQAALTERAQGVTSQEVSTIITSETYERMLCNIDEACVDDARRILALLCFSARPLTMPRLLHAHAVDLENNTLDIEDRLLDYEGVNEICVGLVEVVRVPGWEASVRIAHISVQEYLVSDRIRSQKAKCFALESTSSHDMIGRIFFVYLTDPGLSSCQTAAETRETFPLSSDAADVWHEYYNKESGFSSESKDLILKLFTDEGAFASWVMLCDACETKSEIKPESNLITTKLFHCTLLGLEWLLDHILNTGIKLGYSMADLLNTQGLDHWNALQGAADRGHYTTVQFLLDKVADVNIEGRFFGYALLAGHHTVVHLLLENGADVNAIGGMNNITPLQAASFMGNFLAARMLVDQGADVNAQGGYYGTALQAASIHEDSSVVRLLLDRGAGVISPGSGKYATALQAASYCGHISVVRLLLDRGADANPSRSVAYYTPLQAALQRGHMTVVQTLRDAGAVLKCYDT